MHVSENKRAILLALRHGALTLPVVADVVRRPMFTVRAELIDLKRIRLVTDHFTTIGHEWELTVTGCGIAWSSQQLELLETARYYDELEARRAQ